MYCSVHWGCVGSTHIVKRIRLLRAMPTAHHASDPLFCTRPYSSHNFFLQKSPFDTQVQFVVILPPSSSLQTFP
ncbi:hypothetical protein T05_9028 [Trichinella murrelli]|uniref:Uncharacterized protein n=1 Tax=Trichinella murrelli TaxID=144512 RepID=A0A0V0TUI6_9BILA|nr:hypothetical protein T05_9028 [Trichinella murrelli]